MRTVSACVNFLETLAALDSLDVVHVRPSSKPEQVQCQTQSNLQDSYYSNWRSSPSHTNARELVPISAARHVRLGPIADTYVDADGFLEGTLDGWCIPTFSGLDRPPSPCLPILPLRCRFCRLFVCAARRLPLSDLHSRFQALTGEANLFPVAPPVDTVRQFQE